MRLLPSILLLAVAAPAMAQQPAPAAASDIRFTESDWQSAIAAAEASRCASVRTSAIEPGARAVAIAGQLFAPDDPRLARALTAAAVGEIVAERPTEARAYAERALAVAESGNSNRAPERIAALTALADIGHEQGGYGEPLALAERALALLDGGAAASPVDALYARRLAAFLMLETGRFDEAEALLSRAIAVAEDTPAARHCEMIASRSVLAIIRFRQGRLAEADRMFESIARDSEERFGRDNNWTRGAINTRALVAIDRGNHAEAEAMVRDAIARLPEGESPAMAGNLFVRNRLVSVLIQQRRLDEAKREAKATLALAEANLEPDNPVIADIYEFLAQIYANEGRNEAALSISRRARAMRERVSGREALPTLFLGQPLSYYLVANGLTGEAEALLRADLEIAERVYGARGTQAHAQRIALAHMLAGEGRYDGAVPLFETALADGRRLYGDDSVNVSGIRLALARARWGEGDTVAAERAITELYEDARGRFGLAAPETVRFAGSLARLRLEMPDRQAAALGPARVMASDIARLRNSGGSDSYARYLSSDLTLLVDAMWARAGIDGGKTDVNAAYDALQTAIAGGPDRAVLRTAARSVAEATDPALGQLIRERETLEERATRAGEDADALRGQTGADAAALAQLRAEEAAAETRLTAIDAEITRRFPDYFSLIQPGSITQEQTQSMLADDEAVLLIVPTDFGTHVMALSNSAGTWARAEITRGNVDASVRRMLFDLGAQVDVTPVEAAQWQEEGGRGYPFARTSAWALYTHLFPPAIQEIIAGKSHLFVSTTGSLTGLPLGVLVTEEPTGADGDAATLRATSWLADRHAIMSVPTLQSLWLQRRAGATRPAATSGAGFAGFGDPLLDGVAQTRGGGRGAVRAGGPPASSVGRGDGLADPVQLKALARLPGTATELQDLRRALGAPASSIRLGAAATETALRAADLGDVRILALATHGLMAGDLDPAAQPGLVFTPPQQPSPGDDGLLTPSEIAGLRLNAEWVILSACNTAAGDGSAGAPGLSGLAQSFFFAGARTLLASHWPVRDDVAPRLTVRTIELQRADPTLSRSRAFQQAMREIRNDASQDSTIDSWAHPNAWAPFSLIGDGAR